jgi:hypothetical protein
MTHVPLRRFRQLARGSAILASQLKLCAASIARLKLAHGSPNWTALCLRLQSRTRITGLLPSPVCLDVETDVCASYET